MIILSAQRVSSKSGKGINCTLYRQDVAPSRVADGNLDATAAFDERGELVGYRHELKPGGNDVLSYVDIALTQPKAELIDAIVEKARARLRSGAPPFRLANHDAALELNMNVGLYPQALSELEELVDKAKLLLPKATDVPPWKGGESLRVLVQRTEQGVRYQLDDESADKIRRVLPDWGAAVAITISDDKRDDIREEYERKWGPFLPQLVLLVTRLEEEMVLDMGGVTFVEFVDGATKQICRWPGQDEPV